MLKPKTELALRVLSMVIGGEITQNDIACQFELSNEHIAQIIAPLEAMGLISVDNDLVKLAVPIDIIKSTELEQIHRLYYVDRSLLYSLEFRSTPLNNILITVS